MAAIVDVISATQTRCLEEEKLTEKMLAAHNCSSFINADNINKNFEKHAFVYS